MIKKIAGIAAESGHGLVQLSSIRKGRAVAITGFTDPGDLARFRCDPGDLKR
jgi:hypothetical protein